MRRPIVVALLALSLFCNSWATAAAGALSAPQLTLYVLADTGEPLPRARVEVLSPGRGIVAAGATDAAGRVRIAAPAGPSFWLRVWGLDHAVLEYPWVPRADGYSISVRLSPLYSSLSGLATDQRGRPVAGVRVGAWRQNYGLQAEAITDATGWYTLSRLPAGAYRLQVESAGFDPAVSDPIELAAGNPLRHDVALTPAYGTVTGQAISARDGRPLIGATVQLWRDGVGLVATATLGRDGRFSLTAPPAEQAVYRLYLWARDHAMLTSGPFALTAGGIEAFVNQDRLVAAPLRGSIWGYVTDDRNAPLADLAVELHAQDFGVIAAAQTDADGFFAFTNLPEGQYRVRSAPRDRWESATSAALSVSGGEGLLVDLQPEALELRYHGEAVVTGLVTDLAGGPVSAAEVILRRGTREEQRTTTDNRGIYRFGRVPATADDDDEPGTGYVVRVEAPGYFPAEFGTDAQAATGTLHVTDRAVGRADFRLHPRTGTVRGLVTDDDGLPLAGAALTIYREGEGVVASAGSDADGFFNTGALPAFGAGQFWVVARAGGFFGGGTDRGGAPLSPAVLVDAPGMVLRQDVQLQPATATLTGSVTDQNGRPLAGARVTVRHSAGDAVFATQTDQAGRYTLPGLPAGPQDRLLLRAESAAAAAPGAAATVLQLAGVHAETVHLTLTAPAGAAGVVYGPDGRPAGFATVELRREGDLLPTLVTTTDADGRYAFTGLVPGDRYAVIASTADLLPSPFSPDEAVLTPLFRAEAGVVARQDIGLSALTTPPGWQLPAGSVWPEPGW